MCQLINKQDLMVTTWSILIFFLRHLEICSWSWVTHWPPLFPVSCSHNHAFIYNIIGEEATAAKNLIKLLNWIGLKSESKIKISQIFPWLPWRWVKPGIRVWHFSFKTSRFRNFSIFLYSFRFGIEKIWYRKNLVSKKVSDSVSEKNLVSKKASDSVSDLL